MLWGMKPEITSKGLGGFINGNFFILFSGMGQFVEGLVAHIVLEDIEDKPFFNRLAHGVDMKGFRFSVRSGTAEDLQGLGFWCGGEGKGGKILRTLSGGHDSIDHIL